MTSNSHSTDIGTNGLQLHKPAPAVFHQLALKEQLHQIHLAHGKDKYNLIFNSSKPELLVPRLHPQELYLTINEIGAEDSLELIALASAKQIALILDLDCWDRDTLDPEATLTWLEFLQHCDEEKICQLARETEPETLALMLKKHLTIIRGLEAYDDDDAENAKRMESIYDIEYRSEDAAKIIGGLIRVWQEREQNHFLQIMEILRSESELILEEEVYQRRSARLLDLGIIPLLEAREIYAWVDPQTFSTQDKKDFQLEAETLPSPMALLKAATPQHLLAGILEDGIPHEIACEMLHLVNRKLSADNVDLSTTSAIRDALQETYDSLNLALEYLAKKDIEKASQIFHDTWLQRLFQLGHSLISREVKRAKAIKNQSIFNYFDEPETLFIDLLTQQPVRFYCKGCSECPADISAINTMEQLLQIEGRLTQLEALSGLFCGPFACLLQELPPKTEDSHSLSGILMTAVANQALGHSFSPAPLDQTQLSQLKKHTIDANKPTESFGEVTRRIILTADNSCSFFAINCLEQWCNFFHLFDGNLSSVENQGFLILVGKR